MLKRASQLFAVLVFGAFFMVHAVSAQQSDTIPPSVPIDVTASLNQSFQAYVSWSPSTDNVGVEGYYLYRNGGLVANTPGLTYYTDAAPPGTYFYTVVAYDAAGNISAQSSATYWVVIPADTTAPTAPTNFSAALSSSSVTLSWDQSTDDIGVVGYYVYRNGVRIYTPSTISETDYLDEGLLSGSTYKYTVRAYDVAGNLSDSPPAIYATTIFDITPPSSPYNFLAVPVSSSQINLSWHSATDNIQVGGYSIYREGVLIANVATTSYADAGLLADTAFHYSIKAYDTVGNASFQNVAAIATTFPSDITSPSVPGNFSATAISSSQVNLTWSPSTDNIGVTGYYIYRDGDQIGTAVSNAYSDTDLATSTTYTYAVRSYDDAGNISAQASLAVTTLSYTPIVPVPPVGTQPPVGVTPPPSGGSGFVFTTTLSYGLRNNDVKNLQLILIKQGYLGPDYATGFFGSLTQGAVQKFQCAQGIVCSGSPSATGWGSVGPRTRKALNAM